MIHPFDLTAISLLIGFGYVGYKRGFLEEIGRLTGLILASVVAFQFHDIIAMNLYPWIPIDGRLILAGSFAIVFIITLLSARVLTRFIQMFLLARGIRSANRILGVAVGAVKASVMTIILCWSVDVLPNADYFSEMKTRSYVYQNSSGVRNRILVAFHLEDSVRNSEMWVREKMENK